MRFWDSSSIVPLCTKEDATDKILNLYLHPSQLAVSRTTIVEVNSSIARKGRVADLTSTGVARALSAIASLRKDWVEIDITTTVLDLACDLLYLHPLRAADAIQLAAALTWCDHSSRGREFVCLDRRLATVAAEVGFTVLP